MKCGQIGCDRDATHRVFWPGNLPIPSCEEHSLTAARIAKALGMYVHIEELPNEEGERG